jgi:hypothetical protein
LRQNVVKIDVGLSFLGGFGYFPISRKPVQNSAIFREVLHLLHFAPYRPYKGLSPFDAMALSRVST